MCYVQYLGDMAWFGGDMTWGNVAMGQWGRHDLLPPDVQSQNTQNQTTGQSADLLTPPNTNLITNLLST